MTPGPSRFGSTGRELGTVGVLLANLGTPDDPTPAALRRFLREFLSDPRVIEEPRWKWLPVLNLVILPFRPRRSAALYRKIWRADGSPLLNHSLRLADRVRSALEPAVTAPLHVVTGMRYGRPSIAEALNRLRESGCQRLLVLPLFPQYSGTTTASVFDAVTAELASWRVVPELRTIHHYHDDPRYIEALAASIRALWERDGGPDKLLLSFHGIPQRYATAGDPYPEECLETARRLRAALGLAETQCLVSFQSIFGRERWIQPATDATIAALAKQGVEDLDVICPGFSVDCLETLEEIDQLNRGIFLANGGRRFRYIPCLNDSSEHGALIADLLRENLNGWNGAAFGLEAVKWNSSAS